MASHSVNVSSHLTALAASNPNRVAVYVAQGRGRTALTFYELNAESDALAHGLNQAGITRSTRTAVMVPPSLDFFVLTFALFKVAAVPVMIDPGMGISNLGTSLAEAEPEAFIGIAKAHLARRLFGWGRRTVRTSIMASRRRMFCSYTLDELKTRGTVCGPYQSPSVMADDSAAILFTSGSTGTAKGAIYSHGIFAAQVELLKSTFGIEPGEVDLCTFPLFALFGPALGMTCVIPDMDPSRPAAIDPEKTIAAIHRFGVTNVFGSPAVIRRLGEFGERTGTTLPTVRRAISAGAPASAAEVERFAKMLSSEAQVFTPYGATEVLPVSNIGSDEIIRETRHLTDQGKGVCVGQPVLGVTVNVIAIRDVPIPEWDEALCLPPGQVGEFVVRGPVVTRSYYNRSPATQLAKIHDPKTGEVLHRMGDVGFIDECGRLWFCGRKSHRVETPWGTLYTDQVEPIFNTVRGVSRTALVGETSGGVTRPVVCVEMADSTEGNRQWREVEQDLRRLAMQFAHTSRIETFIEYPTEFPVDVRHNSKIFRERIADYIQNGERSAAVEVFNLVFRRGRMEATS